MNLRFLAFQAATAPVHASGFSLLHAYCIEGDFDSLRLILAYSPGKLDNAISLTIGVASNVTEHAGKTPAEIIREYDSAPHQRISQLLDDITKPFVSRSLFHVAIQRGTCDHVAWLLNLGADVNEVNSSDWSVLVM